jgi:translation initiation factor 4G
LTLDSLGSKAEHAYKRRDANDESISRETELQRCAQSLLNKICPENIETIAKRIKNEAKVATINELEIVIELIFKKALAEPHYCETYAGMVFMLKGEMPSFPNPKGGKDVTFKSILLNVCQSEFEKMPRSIETSLGDEVDEEEMKYRIEKMKGRFLANMKFIGHLFLQKLLGTAIIASIISDLIGSNPGSGDTIPEEHVVECVCELLSAIGYTLEEMIVGKDCVTQVCGRLIDLKSMKKKDGKGLLSKRIQFAIQDVVDMRKAGWVKKTFKAVAKTKEEVRAQQEQEEKDMKNGKSVTGADVLVAGARPSHLQSKIQDDGPWQDISPKKGGRR